MVRHGGGALQSPPFPIGSPTLHAGKTLAVLPTASDFMILWDSLSKGSQKIALGSHIPQQEMRMACWSKEHAHIMIGTAKGTLLIFDPANKRVLQNIPTVHEQVLGLVLPLH